ncbi:MAG: hypothetical protein AAB686_03905 [Patescibacteria group bacterium]
MQPTKQGFHAVDIRAEFLEKLHAIVVEVASRLVSNEDNSSKGFGSPTSPGIHTTGGWQ